MIMRGTEYTNVCSAHFVHWPSPCAPIRGITLYILSALLLGPSSRNKHVNLRSLRSYSYNRNKRSECFSLFPKCRIRQRALYVIIFPLEIPHTVICSSYSLWISSHSDPSNLRLPLSHKSQLVSSLPAQHSLSPGPSYFITVRVMQLHSPSCNLLQWSSHFGLMLKNMSF